MNRQRNITLEIFKLIASYMVVFIHVTFDGRIGDYIDALARFAVPFFFLISGFYSYRSTTEKIKKRMINIFRLLIMAVATYILYDVLCYLFKQDIQGLISYVMQLINIKKWIRLVIFNIPIHHVHLWYLFAILYVYIIFFFITNWRIPEKFVFLMSFSLLLLHLLLGEVLSACKIVVPIPLVRNFALMGIPFFGMGLFISKYRYKLLNIPNWMIAAVAIFGIIATLFSRIKFGKNELYFGSLFILIAVIILSIKYAEREYSQGIYWLIDCSTYIYIYHIMIASIISEIYLYFSINNNTLTKCKIYPLFVCLVSTIVACAINKMMCKVSEKE